MASVSALKAALSEMTEQRNTLQWMVSREPSDVRRTGRIKGVESRYTLRVWYRRNSGTAECLVTHHHPGQSDSVSGPYPLETIGTMYRCDDEEGSAIHRMIDEARAAHFQYDRATV